MTNMNHFRLLPSTVGSNPIRFESIQIQHLRMPHMWSRNTKLQKIFEDQLTDDDEKSVKVYVYRPMK